eukprot:TRINITY_DN5858_c0_g1_i1.p1 TRINITY_DN5858_c0_g1~~TRINITY_DN5858_c0_g1_i1.p1  ORF type:complete len:217 (+),score=88.19 TRINITY_DN5858_c0_g1_i1:202-852(+)
MGNTPLSSCLPNYSYDGLPSGLGPPAGSHGAAQHQQPAQQQQANAAWDTFDDDDFDHVTLEIEPHPPPPAATAPPASPAADGSAAVTSGTSSMVLGRHVHRPAAAAAAAPPPPPEPEADFFADMSVSYTAPKKAEKKIDKLQQPKSSSLSLKLDDATVDVESTGGGWDGEDNLLADEAPGHSRKSTAAQKIKAAREPKQKKLTATKAKFDATFDEI